MAINVRVPLALALVAVLAVTCAYAVPAAQTSFNRAADEGGAGTPPVFFFFSLCLI